MTNTHIGAHPMIPRFIRLFSVPILLGWLALTVLVNVVVPQIEKVGEAHSVSMAPTDAPSMQAMQARRQGFQGVRLQQLGDDRPGRRSTARRRRPPLLRRSDRTSCEADKKHVEHIQDFWGDPLTAAGSQSADGKAAYVQLYLAGNQGESLANESVQAVRDIVANATPPQGVKAYVTGPAAAHELINTTPATRASG